MKLERVSLLLAVGIGSLAGWAQSAPDDPSVAARASLERIQALRKERPGDGVLVFYQALVHVSLGERDAALELLRSLKFFFFQAEDGIRDLIVTGVQTCALPI